jgi:hypothetical protein
MYSRMLATLRRPTRAPRQRPAHRGSRRCGGVAAPPRALPAAALGRDDVAAAPRDDDVAGGGARGVECGRAGCAGARPEGADAAQREPSDHLGRTSRQRRGVKTARRRWLRSSEAWRESHRVLVARVLLQRVDDEQRQLGLLLRIVGEVEVAHLLLHEVPRRSCHDHLAEKRRHVCKPVARASQPPSSQPAVLLGKDPDCLAQPALYRYANRRWRVPSVPMPRVM